VGFTNMVCRGIRCGDAIRPGVMRATRCGVVTSVVGRWMVSCSSGEVVKSEPVVRRGDCFWEFRAAGFREYLAAS
jgi:hypothetical protein